MKEAPPTERFSRQRSRKMSGDKKNSTKSKCDSYQYSKEDETKLTMAVYSYSFPNLTFCFIKLGFQRRLWVLTGFTPRAVALLKPVSNIRRHRQSTLS